VNNRWPYRKLRSLYNRKQRIQESLSNNPLMSLYVHVRLKEQISKIDEEISKIKNFSTYSNVANRTVSYSSLIDSGSSSDDEPPASGNNINNNNNNNSNNNSNNHMQASSTKYQVSPPAFSSPYSEYTDASPDYPPVYNQPSTHTRYYNSQYDLMSSSYNNYKTQSQYYQHRRQSFSSYMYHPYRPATKYGSGKGPRSFSPPPSYSSSLMGHEYNVGCNNISQNYQSVNYATPADNNYAASSAVKEDMMPLIPPIGHATARDNQLDSNPKSILPRQLNQINNSSSILPSFDILIRSLEPRKGENR
jgi:hypothetical protein